MAEDNITIQVDEPHEFEVDTTDLAAAVAVALRFEGRADAEVTVVITDDEEVTALNTQYRGVEGPTDVLSFPTQVPPPGLSTALRTGPSTALRAGFVSAPEAANYLGDIVIALPYTRRQAAELGQPLRDELRLLAVHGTLHLLGYDHAEPEEEAIMWARQDAILEQIANGK